MQNKFKNYNFNLKTGELLKFSDICNENKYGDVEKIIETNLKKVEDTTSQTSKNENVNLASTLKDYDLNDFLLKNNSICFYTKNKSELSLLNKLEIPMRDLNKYINVNVLNNNTSFQKSQNIIEKAIPAPEPVIIPKQNAINKNQKMIALTFDDGPHPIYTQEILNALSAANGHATFFVVGNNASKYPKILKNIIAQGSQIGNHSLTHTQLTKLNANKINEEINGTRDIVYKATKTYPDIIRPPYGSVNQTVQSTTKQPLILWNIDTLDWKTRDKQKTINSVISNAKDGSIVLMHDLYPTSKDAAVSIIDILSKKGYQLVTISELFSTKNKELKPGMVYTGI
ncbi:MAG: polysaccharide deacetylase family protein [Clostridia bacterium]